MINIYQKHVRLASGLLFLIIFLAACKKNSDTPVPAAPKSLATLGLYEQDSSIYRRIYIPITAVGTSASTIYFGVFDTGSTGMTIDANGLIPASMITSNGITVAGDSVTVNGITITSQQAVISYGNASSETQEYGNLAYAKVALGNSGGNITTPRISIFLYYKIVDVQSGKTYPAHSNDVFGVGPGVSYASNKIGSPLSYFATTTGVSNGFKLALLNNNSFSLNGTYVPGLLTIGLTSADLSSSGFIMHPLTYNAQGGYSPNVSATVNYGSGNVSALLLFDTGTPAYTLIANSANASNINTLAANTPVTITTTSGFSYTYTTTSNYNLTQVAKPSYTGDPRTIFSIDFFVSNEFLLDYTNHQIGLKNN